MAVRRRLVQSKSRCAEIVGAVGDDESNERGIHETGNSASNTPDNEMAKCRCELSRMPYTHGRCQTVSG